MEMAALSSQSVFSVLPFSGTILSLPPALSIQSACYYRTLLSVVARTSLRRSAPLFHNLFASAPHGTRNAENSCRME